MSIIIIIFIVIIIVFREGACLWTAVEELLRRHPVEDQLVVLVAEVVFVVKRVYSFRVPGSSTKSEE